jgi:hypothetical protein
MDQVISFLVSPENLAFEVAGCIVVSILLLEILASLVGASLHMFHVDADLDGDVEGVFAWLNPGRVPIMLLMIAFLGCFSIAGYVFNWVWEGVGFKPLNALFICPIVGVCVLPLVAKLSALLGEVLHQDDSNAITLDDLEGHYGKVTMGPFTDKIAGQAKFRDDFGVTHYIDVLAEPGTSVDMGDDVVLLQRLAEDSFMFVVRKVN